MCVKREISALFAWLISHQPAVLFSHNKPVTSNQPAVLFSQNKPALAISHQPTEQAAECHGHMVITSLQSTPRLLVSYYAFHSQWLTAMLPAARQ
jgi:hypothetical protein